MAIAAALNRQMTPRERLWAALEPDAAGKPTAFSFVKWVIMGLVVASLVLLSIETELDAQTRLIATGAAGEGFQAWPQSLRGWIEPANLTILLLFALEYGFRLSACGVDPRYGGTAGMARYVATPAAICDLLAFAPELLMTLLMPHDAGAGAGLAALRMLRLLRLFKAARYVPALDIIFCAFGRARSQLLVTLLMAGALLFVAAAILHFIEGEVRPEQFGSIPRALWWSAVTLTTIGYGDVFPITPLGKFFAACTAILGIAVVALPTGIFAAAISDELKEREARKAAQKGT